MYSLDRFSYYRMAPLSKNSSYIRLLAFAVIATNLAVTKGSISSVCPIIKNLGMQSRDIPAQAITESSVLHNSPQYDGPQARLHNNGSWISARNDGTQWIQVKFAHRKAITMISTQGYTGFIKEFFLSYSDDGLQWKMYNDSQGKDKVFQGNSDGTSVVNNTLNPPLEGMFVKLKAKLCDSEYCALRMELYGCNYTSSSAKCPPLSKPAGSLVSCTASNSVGSTCTFRCQIGYWMIGSPNLHCQPNSTWNGTVPACYAMPSEPRNLKASSIFSRTIAIAWNKPAISSSSVLNYMVYWKADNEQNPKQKLVTKLVANLDVKPYTMYTIKVRARSAYFVSPWSTIFRQRSDEAAPSMAPSNFQVNSYKSLTLTVTWSEIPEEGRNGVIRGYRINYYKNKTKSVPTQINVASDVFTHTISNLVYDDYFVLVAAYTRIGFGPNTTIIRKVPMEGAPTEPQNLKVVNRSSISVFLSWSHPVTANGIIRYYTIKYGFKQDQMVQSTKVKGYLLQSRVQPLEEFSTYYFLVHAETQITGKPSQIVSAKTLEDVPNGVPPIVSVSTRDAYTIFVSWGKVPQDVCNGIILGYIIFYKPNGVNVQYENKTIDDETKLSAEVTGLKPFTEVCVKMAAFTKVGVSRNWDSKACGLITTDQTGPSAPQNIRVTATSSTSILVEWEPPATPNGIIKSYEIYRGNHKDNLVSHGGVTGRTLSKQITGLNKYTTYYVQIRGRTNENGNASEIVKVTTFEDAPGNPEELTCTAFTDTSIMLTWKKPSNSNGIIRSYLITTYDKITSVKIGKPINMTSNLKLLKFVSHLKPFREYVVEVQAVTVKPGDAKVCLVMTKAGAPSAPTNVQAEITGLKIIIKWDPPLEKNGNLEMYKVYCIGRRSYDPRFEKKTKKEVQVDNREVIIKGLYPGTEYEVYVIATTYEKEGKKSKSVFKETSPEAPPAPEQPEASDESVSHDSITLLLKPSPQKNGEVIAHQVIVEALGKKTKRSVDPLPSEISDYKTAKERGSRFYLAAEFRGVEVPQSFVLGDGKHYGSYYNAPLEPATRYRVYVRGVTKNQYGKWIYGFPAATTLPATAEMKTLKKGNDVGLIAGVIGAIILIAIIIIAIVLYRRSKRPLKANVDIENSKCKSRRRFRDLELKRIGGKKRPLSVPGEVVNDPEHPPILMENFAKHVHKLHKSDDRGFMIEYNKLDAGREYACEAAYLADNKNKNRYGNIVAYDHSRVVLAALDGKPCTDYINASHIDGYNKPNAYIATQGPVPHTFDDFWRMVWEQQSATIVMLTNLQERHKLKCHKYWPDATEDYGDISVKLLRCEHYADYSIRTFNVKREIEKEEREVRQFHFTVWPDHGVPEYPTAILAYRRRVRAYNPPDAGPIIVHCSAGVGRSGTFIVIDAMLDRIKAEKTVDIFNYVAYLRSRRTTMVQTEEQYTFCHDAILESIQCGNTQILAHDLRIALSKMDKLDKDMKMTKFETEFKTLNKVSPVLPKACYIVASYPENKEKNRYHDILASDFSRVMLTAIDDNEITTYINAVHISGYKQQHAFMVTQYPLTATVTDFWRMLCEQESACLVVFQPTEEGDFPQFWPEKGKETYDDMITVECHVEKSNSVDNLKSTYDQSEITECKFKLKDLRTPEKEVIVKMFILHGWANEDDPVDTSSMITLVAKVEKWQQQSGNGPITVMCSDGIGRSGTFCALYSVLERVKIEQVVDVLQAIKAMRIPRPGLVKTNAEYKSIYYTVQEYLAAFDDYANFK